MTRADHHVNAVMTGFRVVEELARGDALGVTELTQRTGIAKSSVYKHLDTLRELGYVTKGDDDRYSLSLRWFEAGLYVRDQHDVFALAREELDKLAARTGETVSLVVEEDGDAVYLYQASEDGAGAPMSEGERMPAPLSVGAKAIFAYRPDEEVEAMLDRNDVDSDPEEFLEELQSLRDQRIVIRREPPLQETFSAGAFEGHRHVVGHDEPYRNLHSAAVPLRDPDDYACAAIEISGDESSLYGRRLEEEIAGLLVSAERTVEAAMAQ
ncbi:MAG: IclR family transcriptional regulator [Halapricum sp.]